jgi:hypothetical protein
VAHLAQKFGNTFLICDPFELFNNDELDAIFIDDPLELFFRIAGA